MPSPFTELRHHLPGCITLSLLAGIQCQQLWGFVWVSSRARGHCVWNRVLSVLPSWTCLLRGLLFSLPHPPLHHQLLLWLSPALDRHESSARWWVWRNNRAKALCMLQSAAGGLTPRIPLLRYHQVALKYVFHRSSRIISGVSHCSDVPEDYWHKLSTAWQWQNTSSLQAFGCHITSDSWWFHCTVLSNKIKHKQHA